jgi:Tol biopolymer transport system component
VPDSLTFEARLGEALDRYADRAPVGVDIATVVRAATGRTPAGAARIGWRPRWTAGLRVAIVVALLSLGAAIVLLVAQRPTEPLGGGGRLFLASDRNGWVFEPDLGNGLEVPEGCTATLVDGGAGVATVVRFGPTRVRAVDGDDSSIVWVVDSRAIDGYGGTNMERWSPDGSRYALARFGQQSDTDPVDAPGAIRIVSIHGTADPVDVVFEVRGLSSFAWSPDSNLVALLGRAGAMSQVVVIDLRTGMRTVSDDFRAASAASFPTIWWTGAGSKVAVEVGTDTGDRPALLDVASGAVQVLADPSHLVDAGWLILPSTWSPDGARVIAWRDPSWLLLDAQGTKLGELPAGQLMGGLWGLEPWAPDSRHLAIVDGGRLRIIDADGRDAGQLPLGATLDASYPPFAWSPDGNAIAIGSTKDASLDIALYDTSTLRQLASTTVRAAGVTASTPLCIQWVPPVS